MTDEMIPCLYCQTKNEKQQQNCCHCGMPLAKKHPENKKRRLASFSKVFWFIALFCMVMVWYLPR